jgi:uncharacterized tellurite resistance protein B-like protein
MAADLSFRIEIIKLLLQVAAADDDIDPNEAAMVFDLARQWQLPAEDVKSLEQVVVDKGRLPPPNLSLLKARKAEVLQLARTLQYADGSVAADEQAIIEQISQMLE